MGGRIQVEQLLLTSVFLLALMYGSKLLCSKSSWEEQWSTAGSSGSSILSGAGSTASSILSGVLALTPVFKTRVIVSNNKNDLIIGNNVS